MSTRLLTIHVLGPWDDWCGPMHRMLAPNRACVDVSVGETDTCTNIGSDARSDTRANTETNTRSDTCTNTCTNPIDAYWFLEAEWHGIPQL